MPYPTGPSAPRAWFLGPKAENQEPMERLLLEAFRDYCYWRRNFHPEDQACFRAEDRLQPEYLQYQEKLHDHLFEMLSRLKQSIPFFSQRYLGHMCKDLLVPGTLGYMAAMLYNQNNITQEAASITTELEAMALQQVAQMLGYDPQRAWGHLCSGGTVANMEALWVARNLRLLPWQLALTQQQADSRSAQYLTSALEAAGCDPELADPRQITVSQCLALRSLLQQAIESHPSIGQLLHQTAVNTLGLPGFLAACQQNLQQAPQRLRIAYSQNAHYSLRKSLGLLGLGENAALQIPLDSSLRMDIRALEAALQKLPETDLLLAVVGVYGSTEEGAIDPFEQLLALRQREEAAGRGGFWLHGDACYGGYALALCHPGPDESPTDPAVQLYTYLNQVAAEARQRNPTAPPNPWTVQRCQQWLETARALGQCDSISLDPHKLGYLPYPAGTVFYREAQAREWVRCDAPYINAASQATGEDPWQTPSPGKYTLEGSRPGATSAALWLAHQTVPLHRQGHGRLIAGSLLGTAYLQQTLQAELNRQLPGIHCHMLCQTPDLNLLCYTFSGSWQGQTLSLKQSNALVNWLYQHLLTRQDLRSGDFIVSMTRLAVTTYGAETLNQYWQNLIPGHPSQVQADLSLAAPGDDDHLALIRTVVMDPFLSEAMTREVFQADYQPLVHHYTRTLALLIRSFFE